MRYLIIIFLFPILLFGQSKAYEAITEFKNELVDPFEYEYTLCPWQSWRFIGYYTYQIDLVCDSTALHVLQQDDHLFAEALNYIYRAYPMNLYNVELIRRWDSSPGKYRIHIPGLLAPYNHYYDRVRPADAMDITKQGYGGWYYMNHRSGIGIAVKELGDNQFQVSAAMFLKAIIPN